eukprot:3794256-Amphidinium_carterae.2
MHGSWFERCWFRRNQHCDGIQVETQKGTPHRSAIDWDEKNSRSEPGTASVAETPLSEPAYERQIDYIATLHLPEEVENVVKVHVQSIATATKGRQ